MGDDTINYLIKGPEVYNKVSGIIEIKNKSIRYLDTSKT